MTPTTSNHWKVVRNFIQTVRTDAHEQHIDTNLIKEILGLCDELGTEYVMDMIQHEKRIATKGSAGAFWAEKDRRDEEDFNKPNTGRQSKAVVSRNGQASKEKRNGI